MKRILSLLLPLLLLSSCTKEANDWHGNIYLDDTSEEIEFDELFSEERRISLENHPDAYFHDGSILKWLGDRFYVFDPLSSEKNLIVFDSAGKYLGRIGNFGQGPQEYPALLDFTVNNDSGNVIILSANSQIFIYNTQGDFVTKLKIGDVHLTNLERINDGYLASTTAAETLGNDSVYFFYRFDNDFNLLSAKLKPAQEDNFSLYDSRKITIVNGCGLVFNSYPGVVYLYDCQEDTSGYCYRFRLPMQLPWVPDQDFMELQDALMNHCWTSDFLTDGRIALVTYKGGDQKYHTVALDHDFGNLKRITAGTVPDHLTTANSHFLLLSTPDDNSNIDIVILKAREV